MATKIRRRKVFGGKDEGMVEEANGKTGVKNWKKWAFLAKLYQISCVNGWKLIKGPTYKRGVFVDATESKFKGSRKT